jgi:hypothetical protein
MCLMSVTSASQLVEEIGISRENFQLSALRKTYLSYDVRNTPHRGGSRVVKFMPYS